MSLNNFQNFISEIVFSIQNIHITGIIEILLISYVVYFILNWLRNFKAMNLLKGIGVITFFVVICVVFKFSVILFILERIYGIAAIALVVVFQNDLRQGIEHLGKRNVFFNLISKHRKIDVDHKVVNEISSAAFSMAKVKTGALILIERLDSLNAIINTGIIIDGKVSSALLINIFEKNTPLHDGAVVIVGDTVKAATCYLPLSEDLTISKSLGTRHRAALGISEETDCLTIVVSEETGKVRVVVDREILVVNDEKSLANILVKYVYNKKDDDNTIIKNIKNIIKGEP